MLSILEARNNAKPFFVSVFNKSDRLKPLRSIKPTFSKALLLLSHFHMLSPTLSPSGSYLHYPSSQIICGSTWMNIGERSSSH